MGTVTKLEINGKIHQVDVEPNALLLHVLRENLDLTGTKYGCGEGQCGACTVLIDGVAKRSCLTPIVAVLGRKITTIEGLADGDRLHPLQQAFWDEDAMQCAYCTSGMILTAASLLRANRHPTDDQIAQALNGNICRCGAYPRIIAAVRKASLGFNKDENGLKTKLDIG